MRTEEDQIAKETLQLSLEERGDTVVHQGVPAPDPQYIDVWHVPSCAAAEQPAPPWMALLYRMATEPCLFEPYSETIRPRHVRDNQRKQLVWHHHLCLEARRRGLQAPELPMLWLLSPGRPEGVFAAHDVRPLPGWPPGYYDVARGFRLGLLVLGELPRGAETLVLRLLGGQRLRREALAELAGLEESQAAQALRRLLAQLLERVAHDIHIELAEREAFMTAAKAAFLQYEQSLIDKGVEKGIEKGQEQGLRLGVRLLCQSLGVELTPERVAALEAMDAAAIGELIKQVVAKRAWPA